MGNIVDIPTKISFVALRQLHARTVALVIMDAMNALSLSKEVRVYTIAAVCIQARRAVLAEYTINSQYASFEHTGYTSRSCRAYTPL